MIKPNLKWYRVVSIVQSSMQANMACVCIIIILACFGYEKGPTLPFYYEGNPAAVAALQNVVIVPRQINMFECFQVRNKDYTKRLRNDQFNCDLIYN